MLDLWTAARDETRREWTARLRVGNGPLPIGTADRDVPVVLTFDFDLVVLFSGCCLCSFLLFNGGKRLFEFGLFDLFMWEFCRIDRRS